MKQAKKGNKSEKLREFNPMQISKALKCSTLTFLKNLLSD